MNAERNRAYEALTAATRAARSAPSGRLKACLPDEGDEAAAVRFARLPAAIAKIAPLLRRLDAITPLERRPEESVWETLVLELGEGGQSWIVVANAAGEGDHVTTFGTHKGLSRYFDEWCHCRETSEIGDTPWDEARAQRRVVQYGGEATVIDRGANFVIDAVTAAGCRTVFSCEGHPSGAYLQFHGETQESLAEEFRNAGWIVEAGEAAVTIRMPEVSTVAERDAEWRKLSLVLSLDAVAARP